MFLSRLSLSIPIEERERLPFGRKRPSHNLAVIDVPVNRFVYDIRYSYPPRPVGTPPRRRLKPGCLTTERSDILQFEKRCEARQNEIRDGSVAGVGSHIRHTTGESAIEEQRKAGSRSQSPKGLVRLTNAATPSMPPHSQANRAILRPSGVPRPRGGADRHSPLDAALLRTQNRSCL